jgi:hypothetical protein
MSGNEGKTSSTLLRSRLDVCLCVCIDITQHMNELNLNLQGENEIMNEVLDNKQRSRGNFDPGNYKFRERKSPLMLRNARKKFSFFNKNSRYTQV